MLPAFSLLPKFRPTPTTPEAAATSSMEDTFDSDGKDGTELTVEGQMSRGKPRGGGGSDGIALLPPLVAHRMPDRDAAG